MKKKFFDSTFCSGEEGVVLMETVIALPLYLILLAGLFWLGEVCLAKLSFTSGENLRLWEEDSRHVSSPVQEKTLFPFLASDGRISTTGSLFVFEKSAPSQTTAWGRKITGKSTMMTRRSDWSWQVNRTALAAMGVEEGMPGRNQEISSSDRQILKRSNYSGRYRIYTAGTDSGNLWLNEYGTRWELGDGSVIEPPAMEDTPRIVRLYNGGSRNANYNQWSL
ncbi:MAG: hypothetical protein IKD44_04570 [Lentisphaeria bacterium]|nr:hypothetical protein [Lentisphaeria bacterium]